MRAARALTTASIPSSLTVWREALHGMEAGLVDDLGASWRIAPSLQGRIASGMFGRYLQSFRSGRCLQSEGGRALALAHVCKALSGLAGPILPEPAAGNALPKGALRPLEVG